MLLMASSVPDNCGQSYIVTFSHARHDLLTPFRDKSPGPKQPFSSAFSPELGDPAQWKLLTSFLLPSSSLLVVLGSCLLILPTSLTLKVKHPPWTSPYRAPLGQGFVKESELRLWMLLFKADYYSYHPYLENEFCLFWIQTSLANQK